MEKFRNTTAQNIISVSIVVIIVVLSTLYAISTLFPNIFS
jgi:hypothetical protein